MKAFVQSLCAKQQVRLVCRSQTGLTYFQQVYGKDIYLRFAAAFKIYLKLQIVIDDRLHLLLGRHTLQDRAERDSSVEEGPKLEGYECHRKEPRDERAGVGTAARACVCMSRQRWGPSEVSPQRAGRAERKLSWNAILAGTAVCEQASFETMAQGDCGGASHSEQASVRPESW
jgi:hypothetical protein